MWNMSDEYYLNHVLPIVLKKSPDDIKTFIMSTDITTYKRLVKRLRIRHDLLLATATDHSLIFKSEKPQSDPRKRQNTASINTTTAGKASVHKSNQHFAKSNSTLTCAFCDGNHKSKFCKKYKTATERKSRLIFLKRCASCLKAEHTGACNTRQTIACFRCKGPHYAFLCESQYSGTASNNAVSTLLNASVNVLSAFPLDRQRIVRACAIGPKEAEMVRVFLDEGAMFSVVTWRLVKRLNLPIQAMKPLTFRGFTGGQRTSTYSSRFILKSTDGLQSYTVMCCIDDDVPCFSSAISAEAVRLAAEKNIAFSDLAFGNRPFDAIDIMFASYDSHCISNDKIFLNKELIAINSMFGWGLTGRDSSINLSSRPITSNLSLTVADDDLFNLKRMWAMEGLNDSNKLKEEFKIADFSHLISFVDNRYCVRLPWSEKKENLKSNFSVAFSRLKQLKASLNKKQNFFKYDCAIKEYVKNGHAEPSDSPANEGYYLPHHAVFREDKQTTKIRVVHEGNSHSRNNLSLNDHLFKGIDVLPRLLSLLIKFRLKPVAMVADFEKAYLQLRIHPEDRKFIKYLWYDEHNRLQHMQMTSVIFGANCSPFLLALVILTHFEKQKNSYPSAYAEKDKFYVDDFVSSVENTENAQKIKDELQSLFELCSMNLCKWRSSDPILDKKWTKDAGQELISVLGAKWLVRSDQISIAQPKKFSTRITKRSLLCRIAAVFDPLGLICPAVLNSKLCLRELFKNKVCWDAELKDETISEVNNALAQLDGLTDVKVPRFVGCCAEPKAFAVFCDASQSAYGVVIYAVDQENRHSSLLMAKSRVAPLKELTIPQLELVAAEYATEIWQIIKSEVNARSVRFFSDSTVTLGRIQSLSTTTQPKFVSTRVKKIIERTSPEMWFHVSSEDNPADWTTKCRPISELQSSSLWWKGPDWLVEQDQAAFVASASVWFSGLCTLVEDTPVIAVVNAIESNAAESNQLAKVNTFRKWSTVDLVCKSIMLFARKRFAQKHPDMNQAQLRNVVYIKMQQACSFMHIRNQLLKTEYAQHQQGMAFMDGSGIIRLKARTSNHRLGIEDPVLLDGNCLVTVLWIRWLHKNSGHSGLSVVMNSLRASYHVLKLRVACRKAIHMCITCRVANAKPFKPELGVLPKFRLESCFFKNIGIDHFGPFNIKERGRRNALFPAYVLIATCAATRFVRLELVDSLSAQDTLLALGRIFNRHGTPRLIYSDNGAAFSSLADEFKNLRENHSLDSSLFHPAETPHWQTSAPYAPWEGGFFERLIACVKRTFASTLRNRTVSRTMFASLLCQAEAIVNSRPLIRDATGEIITPAHFAGSSNLVSFPSVDDSPVSRRSLLKQYEDHRSLHKLFWTIFENEYLATLRNRWWKESAVNIAVGDLVLIHEKTLPRSQWPIAIVSEILAGRDKTTRNVIVTVNNKEYRRSTRSLIPLEASTSG